MAIPSIYKGPLLNPGQPTIVDFIFSRNSATMVRKSIVPLRFGTGSFLFIFLDIVNDEFLKKLNIVEFKSLKRFPHKKSWKGVPGCSRLGQRRVSPLLDPQWYDLTLPMNAATDPFTIRVMSRAFLQESELPGKYHVNPTLLAFLKRLKGHIRRFPAPV